MKWNRLNRAGFTILEVLVAMFIIAFGLVALMRALSGGITGSKTAHDVTIATLLAQQKMEETRVDDWPDEVADGVVTFDPPNNNFEGQMTIADVTGETDLREVSLSIYWRSKQRCVNVRTYMADRS